MGTVRYTVVDGEILSELRGGVKRDYVPDPLGSTVALLDSTQTITDTFSYWPYGESAGRTGTTATPFQYIGTEGYYSDSSGRNYVRARYLDKGKGRWITEDTVVSDSNTFVYSWNNPLTFFDSNGYYPQSGYKPVPPYDPRYPGFLPPSNCYQWACGGPSPFPGKINDPRLRVDCSFLIKKALQQGSIIPISKNGKCPSGYHKVRAYKNPPVPFIIVTIEGKQYPWWGDFHWVRQDPDGSWSDQHGSGGAVHIGIRDPDKHSCKEFYGSPGNPGIPNYTRCPGEFCSKNSSVTPIKAW